MEDRSSGDFCVETAHMTFEDLDAWKRSRLLVNRIYTLTRYEALARDFRLCDQLQRAAVSIMTNIAEGFERTHIAEKLQFFNIARGSAGEVEDNYDVLASAADDLRSDIVNVEKLVSGLIAATEMRQR
jgi:four helix bundle protein